MPLIFFFLQKVNISDIYGGRRRHKSQADYRNMVRVEQAGLLRVMGFTDMTLSTGRVFGFSGVTRKVRRKDMFRGKTSKRKSVF